MKYKIREFAELLQLLQINKVPSMKSWNLRNFLNFWNILWCCGFYRIYRAVVEYLCNPSPLWKLLCRIFISAQNGRQYGHMNERRLNHKRNVVQGTKRGQIWIKKSQKCEEPYFSWSAILDFPKERTENSFNTKNQQN